MTLLRLTRHRRPEARLAVHVLSPLGRAHAGWVGRQQSLLDRTYPREASGSGGMRGHVGTELGVRHACVKRAGSQARTSSAGAAKPGRSMTNEPAVHTGG